VADEVEAASGLPLIHIADATARAVLDAGVRRVGLLATGFTMEETFYVGRLAGHGIETTVPDRDARAEVHRIIYDELVRDVVNPASREVYRQVMADLVADGVEGIVLGCTEVGLLVGPDDTTVPTFDTVALHAAAAVDWMLAAGPEG
jgi:aspartate racemase